jgi:hypothetical protein
MPDSDNKTNNFTPQDLPCLEKIISIIREDRLPRQVRFPSNQTVDSQWITGRRDCRTSIVKELESLAKGLRENS